MQKPSPPPIGLYVHVPFCASKCAYCDFASYAHRKADIPRYVDAVIQEITRRSAETGHPRADTIFLGGGTPSLLDKLQVTYILDALFEAFDVDEDAEITCECNPGTLSKPFAKSLYESGVNRLSLGSQAKQAHLLQLLGRIHNWKKVIGSVEIARQAGFDNINLDLMLGLPTQTIPDLQETLTAAIELFPTHLSCYSLIVEEGTPIHRDITSGRLTLPTEEIDRRMYELTRQTLTAHGFEQYEISNFARPGYACRHNLGCWQRIPYLGFGCAAHSFFDEHRTQNPSTLDAYLTGEAPQTESITPEQARFETMMLGLRMIAGVNDTDFTRMHGLTIREAFAEKLDRPLQEGLLQWQETTLRLTPLGLNLENRVLVDLM